MLAPQCERWSHYFCITSGGLVTAASGTPDCCVQANVLWLHFETYCDLVTYNKINSKNLVFPVSATELRTPLEILKGKSDKGIFSYVNRVTLKGP